nr:MAG TPA: hypothetical protein [Caudoviricetes sp.]
MYAIGCYHLSKCRRCNVSGFDSPACLYPETGKFENMEE